MDIGADKCRIETVTAKGAMPSFNICACSGPECGYEGYQPSAALRARARWMKIGYAWVNEKEKPMD